jgi:hypothetical protein
VGVDDDPADEALLVAGSHEAEAFGLFYRRRVDAVLAFFLRRTGDQRRAIPQLCTTAGIDTDI